VPWGKTQVQHQLKVDLLPENNLTNLTLTESGFWYTSNENNVTMLREKNKEYKSSFVFFFAYRILTDMHQQCCGLLLLVCFQ